MDKPAKQQLVAKIKSANNILLAVSSSPSADQLATAIGLALLLAKLKKHVVAVYSGETPSALDFLQPEATIEKNTDSLQDFIISLDRSKADKLRYKVEDDLVKIFITPYRTGIVEEDLSFTQGEPNVDLVIALGVDARDHLDDVIVAHGQILHDAVVASMMAGENVSNIGSINWQEQDSSSLAEMAVKIGDALQPGIIDAQMATAFLTGLVSETERFKNQKTNSKVMTAAAQLVAAGANPQLVAENLEGLVASIIDDEGAVDGYTATEPLTDDQPLSGSAKPAEVLTLNDDEQTKDIHLREETKTKDEQNIDYIHIDQNGSLSRVDSAGNPIDTVAKSKPQAAKEPPQSASPPPPPSSPVAPPTAPPEPQQPTAPPPPQQPTAPPPPQQPMSPPTPQRTSLREHMRPLSPAPSRNSSSPRPAVMSNNPIPTGTTSPNQPQMATTEQIADNRIVSSPPPPIASRISPPRLMVADNQQSTQDQIQASHVSNTAPSPVSKYSPPPITEANLGPTPAMRQGSASPPPLGSGLMQHSSNAMNVAPPPLLPPPPVVPSR